MKKYFKSFNLYYEQTSYQFASAAGLSMDETRVLAKLQQLSVLAQKGGKVVSGVRWVYNSVREWLEKYFIWLTTSKLRRIFDLLIAKGFLARQQMQLKKYDRRYSYAVNQQLIEETLLDYWENLAPIKPQINEEQGVDPFADDPDSIYLDPIIDPLDQQQYQSEVAKEPVRTLEEISETVAKETVKKIEELREVKPKETVVARAVAQPPQKISLSAWELKLNSLDINVDESLRELLRRAHASQIKAAINTIENNWENITDKTRYFAAILPKMKIEQLGTRLPEIGGQMRQEYDRISQEIHSEEYQKSWAALKAKLPFAERLRG